MFSTKLNFVTVVASLGLAHARLNAVKSGGVIAVDATSTAGRSSCPCIGIEGLQGEVFVSLHNTSFKYPAEVGSKCAAWDNVNDAKDCSGDSKAPWCAQKWCYVDPCKCDSAQMKSPPHPSHMLANSASRAMPLYYSYATCESEDVYTSTENTHACPKAKTEEACDEEGCTWSDSEAWGKVCLGMEAGGLCGESSHVEEWGAQDCPCVGFVGTNGTVQASVGNGAFATFPADVGSKCDAWDMARNPDCSGAKKVEGCDQKWCYVDATNCKAKKHMASMYAGKAKTSGHQLHFSYDTCGSKTPKVPPQGTAHFHVAKAAKKAVSEDPEDEEFPIRHDLPMVSRDNPTEMANAAKAAAKRAGQVRAPTPMEIARAEFAKKHPKRSNQVNHEAFENEWHTEYANGHVPTWKELHPAAAKAYKEGSQA